MDKIKCIECGKEFEPRNGNEKICSYGCAMTRKRKSRERYRNLRKNNIGGRNAKICRYCGATYIPGSNNQKYCNVRCKEMAKAAQPKKEILPSRTVDRLDEKAMRAREMGISYGEMMAQQYIRDMWAKGGDDAGI